ncbi:MAG TPA: TIGR02530 family flagellar biosynthesis protein [Chloroflexota bacterium]|jgi:flagellar operon protein|nr:TIGR02530 family flagellar biosynthesis protein [Chloroflexota bacterium]
MLDRIQPGRIDAARSSGEQLVVRTPVPSGGPAFGELLAARLGADGIRLSAHAQKRLAGVGLDGTAADRLKSAVERAEEKGARESLIFVDDLAFVVSVKNKTVITAVDQGRAKENVFTNIDSVVIG